MGIFPHGCATASAWGYSGTVGIFSPSQVPGLVLWLDTSAPSYMLNGSGSPPANLDTVAQITDRSTSANDATQGTDAARPVFTENALGTAYGLAFSGSQLMDLDATISSVAGTGFAYFAVFVAASPGDTIFGFSTTNPAILIANSTLVRVRDTVGAVYAASVAELGASTQHVLTVTRDTSHNLRVYIDGVASVSNPLTMNAGLSIARIGMRGASSDPMNGKIGSMLAFSGLPSTGNLNNVGRYLAAMYGTTWTAIP